VNTELRYVNLAGEPVSLDPSLHARKREKKEPSSYHKGWRVLGLPKGAIEEARLHHEAARTDALRRAQDDKSVKVPKAWDLEAWLRTCKKKSVRSKPYELLDAAEQCKTLAEKEGWTHVEVRAISRD
jgi:hypothetical protein